MIDYVTSHKDLGVIVTSKLLWAEHCSQLVSNASSKLGLLMRTCHFTSNKRQKRAFYLTIVRSIFLRNRHLDSMSFIFNNAYPTRDSRSKLYKSFYYRTIHTWNALDFNTRNTADIVEFKRVTKRHLIKFWKLYSQ